MNQGVRQQQKQATRSALLEAAGRTIGERGYEQTTIAHIARAASVATGTFYVHFESKDHLLDSLLERFNEELERDLVGAVAGVEGEATAVILERIAETFLDHWSRNRTFVEVYSRRIAGHLTAEDLSRGVNPPMTRFLELMLAQRYPDRPPLERHLLSQAVLAVWLRLGLQFLFNDDVNRSAVRESLVGLTLAMVEADRTGEKR